MAMHPGITSIFRRRLEMQMLWPGALRDLVCSLGKVGDAGCGLEIRILECGKVGVFGVRSWVFDSECNRF